MSLTPFDVLGPLPRPGTTTVLEASAGTGKTYTVAALVTRCVAEGVCSLDQMLVVTFGRAASQELRERVRDQLVAAAAALIDPASAREAGGVVGLLAQADDQVVEQRRARLLDALASFDAATIATTHQFCQIVLRSLGVAGDTDPSARLVEDLDDLVTEVVDDLLVARYSTLERAPISRTEMLRLARAVVGDPHTELTPSDPPIGSASQERVEVAREIRKLMDERKARLGLLSFDDLLSLLADALEDPQSPARARMQERWKLVLVDEFQDTDPVQWQVLERAFDGVATLVLIGDPKQAIYAFRGGDIDSYLDAVRTAGTRHTLAVNHRSDGPLVDALQVLTRGAALGHPEIVVQPVEAAHREPRLSGLPNPAPVRVRTLPGSDDGRLLRVGDVRPLVAADLADDVARLLASGATFDDHGTVRAVRAGDVAVLMYSLVHAHDVARELAARGIPSVRGADRTSVLSTPAADDWVVLLQALERQTTERVRSAALTSFFGRTAAELDAEGDDLTDDLAERLRDLVDVYRFRGVAAVQESLFGDGVAARLLGRSDGERHLTDLDHVGELLHEVAHGRRLGVSALLTWLRDERRDATPGTERQRRLDTDAAAVQLVTIHSSKGLQYPIVYLPFAFNRFIGEVDDEVALRHHVAGERMLEVGRPDGDDRARHAEVGRRSRREDAAEELRLTYVAMTRAQSQVVAWWGATRDSAHGGISRLLIGREVGDPEVPAALEVVDDDVARARLAEWERAGGLVVESVGGDRASLPAPAPDTSALFARELDRTIDADWRRTSYTGLVRAAEGTSTVAASEPEVAGTVDEDQPEDDDPVIAVRLPSDGIVSPMTDLPAGPGFGSLIHGVLELADPDAPDLAAELTTVVTDQLRWWPVDATVEDLVAGLLPVFASPLGDVAHGVTLGDIPLTDRLCELDFEIPLAGGDRPAESAAVQLGQMADVLRRHLPSDDPLVRYPDHLGGPLGEQALRGYLGGSIDVLLRVGPPGDQSFVVVDYKTNRLGVPDHPLTALDYTPEHMAESMIHSHYPLQALLYSVVVHRYLRWRLPDYDPERHLGGIAYLYVRGMCGPDTPIVDGMPCGVFTWRPPAAAVVELSDLLAGRAVRA